MPKSAHDLYPQRRPSDPDLRVSRVPRQVDLFEARDLGSKPIIPPLKLSPVQIDLAFGQAASLENTTTSPVVSWLKIDFNLEGLLGVSPEIRSRLKDVLDAALDDAHSSAILVEREGVLGLLKENLTRFEAQVAHHYYDDFNLIVEGECVKFFPMLHTTDHDR